jgi:two-component system cell cycle response regulator
MPQDGARKAAILRTAYPVAVGVGGLAFLALTLPNSLRQASSVGYLGLVVFLVMGILSEWAFVPLVRGAMSLSYAVVLPTFILYGAGAAAAVEVVGYLLGTFFERRGWRVKLFNCGQYALTVFVASAAYSLMGGTPGTRFDLVGFLGVGVFTLVYFIVNHALVGFFFTLDHPEESARVIWGEPAKWESLTYLITAPLGVAVIILHSVGGLLAAIALFVVSFVAALIFRLAFRLDNLNQELRTLYESAQSLGQGLDLESVKTKVFDALGRLAPWDLAVLFLWDDLGQVLQAVDGLPAGNSLEGRSFRLGEGIVGGVAERRVVEVVSDSRTDPRLGEDAAWQPPGSLVVAPMATEEGLAGVLVLGAAGEARYTDEHVRLLTIFAAQAGAALSRAMRYQETRQMAITDSKTGVYNYRFFYERLTDEIRRHEAKETPFSLIFVDVDYLKGINDRYGHQVGDEVLVRVAELIKDGVRTTDEVARYGGEEFVVLLPGAAGDEALVVAERIRRAVEAHLFECQHCVAPVRVTVTAGVATYPEHATQPDELIFRADEAMYYGKHRGRNRVSLYTAAVVLPEAGPA